MKSNNITVSVVTSDMYDHLDMIWWTDQSKRNSQDVYRSRFRSKSIECDYTKFVEFLDTWFPNRHVVNEMYDNRRIPYVDEMKIQSGKPETVVEYFSGSSGRDGYYGYFRYCPSVDEEKNTFKTADFEVVVSTVDGIDMKKFSVAISKLSSVKERPAPIHMIVQNRHGLDIQDFSIQSPVISIDENYEDFEEKHEYLMERLLKGTKKGICLLHGEPGTGKSMYIRHIVDRISKEKTVIYIPNQLISCLTDPGFIPLMAEHSNSVIVIEDADEAIKSREAGGATVDKLLNMADGIVSDFLGMQIICTFNTDIKNIDTALLRKGRLIFKHEFKRLSPEKASALSTKIGANKEYEKPTTLAEIYNDADQFQEEEKIKRKIGF